MLKEAGRAALSRIHPEWLYPTPVVGLQPERLYLYLDAIHERRHLDGAIVEIGCWLGGTTAIASRFTRRIGSDQPYIAIDTFNGFVESQYDNDPAPDSDRDMFGETSRDLVARLLARWDGDATLIEGDIVTLDESLLPDRIAVALIDVDLDEPVYAAMTKLWPRLVPGGIILVDDCPQETSWAGARQGYTRFATEHGLPLTFTYGLAALAR